MHFNIKILLVLIVTLFSVANNDLHAQFLKNVLNSVKQTGQNNTTNKVDQVTNNVLDKVENVGKKKSKGTTTSSNSSNTVADTTKPAGNNKQTQNTNTGSNNTNNA